MREILFRGKRADNNEWVEGMMTAQGKRVAQIGTFIDYGNHICVCSSYAVLPETVGQYTGLTDKNDKKIFEGDIVKYKSNVTYLGKFLECIGQVEYNETTASYAVNAKDNIGAKNYDYFPIKCEVIGNIHDNPELLERGEQI